MMATRHQLRAILKAGIAHAENDGCTVSAPDQLIENILTAIGPESLYIRAEGDIKRKQLAERNKTITMMFVDYRLKGVSRTKALYDIQREYGYLSVKSISYIVRGMNEAAIERMRNPESAAQGN